MGSHLNAAGHPRKLARFRDDALAGLEVHFQDRHCRSVDRMLHHCSFLATLFSRGMLSRFVSGQAPVQGVKFVARVVLDDDAASSFGWLYAYARPQRAL